MAKATTLERLNQCWREQRVATHRRAFSAAGNLPEDRWAQVFNAHKRRVLRRKGLRNRAVWVASRLNDIQVWSALIGSNRKHIGLPPQIYRVTGNGGKVEVI